MPEAGVGEPLGNMKQIEKEMDAGGESPEFQVTDGASTCSSAIEMQFYE